jgi:hypothetical protein
MTRKPDTAGIEKGRFVTQGINLQVEANPGQSFFITLSMAYFMAGKYIQHTGKGKDSKAVFLTVMYTF